MDTKKKRKLEIPATAAAFEWHAKLSPRKRNFYRKSFQLCAFFATITSTPSSDVLARPKRVYRARRFIAVV